MDTGPDIKIEKYIPGKIVCVGMNYRSHIAEQDGRFPEKPVLFGKARTCIIKNTEDIIYPEEVKELDYEVELAVIISKTAKYVATSEAHGYIYGYTIINDVTARDLQHSEKQWYRAKSFDTFGPIGPRIVKKEKIPDCQDLVLRSYVNGELRQDSKTDDMVFGVSEIISYISKSITLERGDLIATGTPAGVGLFKKGQKMLRPGDEIICEIEGIGKLVNKVVSHERGN